MRLAVLLLTLLVIVSLTLLAFGLPVGPSLGLMAHGAFGDKFGLARTLVKSIPLLILAMGIVIAWKAGMYNIGGEGQFVCGGLAAAILFKAVGPNVPGPIFWVLALALSALCGSGYAWLAGWLFTKRGVSVVIGTILLNFVAIQVLAWAVAGPLRQADGALPQSDLIPDRLLLPKFDRQVDLHAGIFLAALAPLAVWWFLYRSKTGFDLRVVGASPSAARANRIPAERLQRLSMSLSGALCGLAGGIEYLGITGQVGSSFSQQWGFLAIPVALLGGLEPWLVAVCALFFGALFAGSEQLARFSTGGPTLVFVIQGVAVLAVVAAQTIRSRRAKVAAE